MNSNQVHYKIPRTQWINGFVRKRMPALYFDYCEDVCQEIMIKMLKADKRQGSKIENYGYIKQTSMSVLIDFIRKHKNSQLNDSYESHLHDQESNHDDPEQLAHQHRLIEKINAIITTFPQRCQDTLLLYLRGMQINEIVELTGSNKSVVRNDIYRSKEKLLTTLNNQGIHYEI